MPLFEYECKECGAVSEILMRQETKPACEKCNSKKLNKLMSAPAGHIKNSLPVHASCPPSDAPPCRPGCCRM